MTKKAFAVDTAGVYAQSTGAHEFVRFGYCFRRVLSIDHIT